MNLKVCLYYSHRNKSVHQVKYICMYIECVDIITHILRYMTNTQALLHIFNLE